MGNCRSVSALPDGISETGVNNDDIYVDAETNHSFPISKAEQSQGESNSEQALPKSQQQQQQQQQQQHNKQQNKTPSFFDYFDLDEASLHASVTKEISSSVPSSAQLLLAWHRQTGLSYSVKRIELDNHQQLYQQYHQKKGGKSKTKMDEEQDYYSKSPLDHEIFNLQELANTPHVVHLHQYFVEPMLPPRRGNRRNQKRHYMPKPNDASLFCFIVMERMEGGTLMERFREKVRFTEDETKQVAWNLLEAFVHIHKKRIAHRNLTLTNLLLPDLLSCSNVKVTGFEYSKKLSHHNSLKTLCGVPGYIAPEMMERWPAYDTKCDLWSIGVLLFQLLTHGEMPFEGLTPEETLQRTHKGQFDFIARTKHQQQQYDNLSTVAKKFVGCLLTVQPHKRYSAQQAQTHDWFHKMDNDLRTNKSRPRQSEYQPPPAPLQQQAKLMAPPPPTSPPARIPSFGLDGIASPRLRQRQEQQQDHHQRRLMSPHHHQHDDNMTDLYSPAPPSSRRLPPAESPISVSTINSGSTNTSELRTQTRQAPSHQLDPHSLLVAAPPPLLSPLDPEFAPEEEQPTTIQNNSDRLQMMPPSNTIVTQSEIQERAQLGNFKPVRRERHHQESQEQTHYQTMTSSLPPEDELLQRLQLQREQRRPQPQNDIPRGRLTIGQFQSHRPQVPYEGQFKPISPQPPPGSASVGTPSTTPPPSSLSQEKATGIAKMPPKGAGSEYGQFSSFRNQKSPAPNHMVSRTGLIAPSEDSKHGPFEKYYALGDLLGMGEFAEIFRATHLRTKTSWAVKKISTARLDQVAGEPGLSTLEDEITALRSLQAGPHIVHLRDVFRATNVTYIILDELKGGDLLQRIATRDVYTERDAKRLCHMLLEALEYMHQRKVAHRDIKPENILLVDPDEFTIQVADFGFAKKVRGPSSLTTLCGTAEYVAPEVLKEERRYDERVDIWSCGVVAYHILSGHQPFNNREDIMNGRYDLNDEDRWAEVSTDAKEFVSDLLVVDPRDRLTATEALKTRWVMKHYENLQSVDLSDAKDRIKSSLSGERLRVAVRAVIAVNKFTSIKTSFRPSEGKSNGFASMPSLLKIVDLATSSSHLPTSSSGVASRSQTPASQLMDLMEVQEEAEPVEEDSTTGKSFRELYKMGRELSAHTFSVMLEATHQQSENRYAVKAFSRRGMHAQDAAALKQEISALRELQGCSSIITLRDIFEEQDNSYIVLERMEGGDLQSRVSQRDAYQEPQARTVTRNILLGIRHCHRRKIALRHLTARNILLVHHDDDTKIKIIDFGLAKKVLYENSLRTKCGDVHHVAPEVLAPHPAYDVSCDMWSMGVILFLLLGGYRPFREKEGTDITKAIRQGKFKFHKKYWSVISDEAKQLVRRMLCVDPISRITAEGALESMWIMAGNFKDDEDENKNTKPKANNNALASSSAHSARARKNTDDMA